jgi:hypothetical protein
LKEACFLRPHLLDPAWCAHNDVWALLLVLQQLPLCLEVHATKEVAHLDVQWLAKALKLAADLHNGGSCETLKANE